MAVSAHGTILKMGDGNGGEFTVAEVLDIDVASTSFDVALLWEDMNPHPIVRPGEVTVGEVTFDVNYTGETSQAAMRDVHTSQELRSWQVVFPTDPESVATFNGYVTALTILAPVEGILRASVTITMASPMEYAP